MVLYKAILFSWFHLSCLSSRMQSLVIKIEYLIKPTEYLIKCTFPSSKVVYSTEPFSLSSIGMLPKIASFSSVAI